MINYIFNTLASQKRFNRAVRNFTLCAAVYVVITEIHNRAQDERIYELKKEIGEIKRVKGD